MFRIIFGIICLSFYSNLHAQNLIQITTNKMEVVRMYKVLLKAEINNNQGLRPVSCGFCYAEGPGIPDTGDRVIIGELNKKGTIIEAAFTNWEADFTYLFRSFVAFSDSLIYGDLLSCTLHEENYGVSFETKVGSLTHPSLITLEQQNFKKKKQILHTLNPELIPEKAIDIGYNLEVHDPSEILDQGLVTSQQLFPTIYRNDKKIDHWQSGKPYRVFLIPDIPIYYRAYVTSKSGTIYGIMYEVELKMEGDQPMINSISYPTTTETPTAGQPDKKQIIGFVNEIRASGGYCAKTYYPPAPPVQWSETLAAIALDYSKKMDQKNLLTHHLPGVPNLKDRAKNENYDFLYIGENLARGEFFSEKTVIDGWFESSDHCVNLMNPNFKEMGVARSGSYWTQLLGASN